jgi:hypothetical protein
MEKKYHLEDSKQMTCLSIESLKPHILCLIVPITEPTPIGVLITPNFLLSLCGDEISYKSPASCELLPPFR